MQQILEHKGLGNEVPIVLTKEQLERIREIQSKNPQLVFYGFAKLTPKIVRKRSVMILFETSNSWSERKERFIRQKMEIIHVRKQTDDEILRFKKELREFVRFEFFVDDRRYKGNLERVLEDNFVFDVKDVSLYESTIIREKLRNSYHSFYKISSRAEGQQSLIFD